MSARQRHVIHTYPYNGSIQHGPFCLCGHPPSGAQAGLCKNI